MVAGLAVILGMAYFLVRPRVTDVTAVAPLEPTLPGKVPDPAIPPRAPLVSAVGVNPRLLQFIQTESSSLNSTKLDADAAERKVREEAAAMGEAEFRYAKDLALLTTAPANERILAVYLLARAQPRSWAVLADIVSAPLPNSGRAEPHSVDEAKAAQEKAMRLIPIDELADAAVKNLESREELKRWEAAQRDPTVKRYIQRKISELPPL